MVVVCFVADMVDCFWFGCLVVFVILVFVLLMLFVVCLCVFSNIKSVYNLSFAMICT